MTINFYINSGMIKIYQRWKDIGRGMRPVQMAFECHIVPFRQPFVITKEGNKYDRCILESECPNIMRVGEEHLNSYSEYTKIPHENSNKNIIL